MTLPRPHDVLPRTRHDDASRFAFVNELRGLLEARVTPVLMQRTDERAGSPLPGYRPELLRSTWEALSDDPLFQDWACLQRSAQEQMWEVAGHVVDADADHLAAAERAHAGNDVILDPAFVPPRYLAAVDTHCMPGSYLLDAETRQGAMFDLAACIYHMGRNGGALNDLRGHTLVQHVFDRFPGAGIRSIVEMGCTVGHSTVAIAGYFPGADYVALDVGAGILRYAAARAAALGVRARFLQASAEATGLPDGSADLVCSAVMLHETSNRALDAIMAESLRLLKPGGIAVHLEVPLAYERASLWTQVRGEFECLCNNEPFWRGCNTADLAGRMWAAGFADVVDAYQRTTARAERDGPPQFTEAQGPVFACWRVLSGRKPSGDDAAP